MEARGLLDEAIGAYEANVVSGVADRRPYERLAALARLRRDAVMEARALRGLADLLDPPPPAPTQPDAPAPTPQPGRPALTPTESDVVSARVLQPPRPHTGAGEPVREASAGEGLHGTDGEERRPSRVAGDGEWRRGVAPNPDDGPGQAAADPDDAPDDAGQTGTARLQRVQTQPVQAVRTSAGLAWLKRGGWRPALLAVGVALIVLGALGVVPRIAERLSVESAPTPLPAAPPGTLRPAEPALPASSPSPAALDLRLVAGLNADRTPSPVALAPSPSPVPTATPLPARCTDAAVRFPESQDSEAAVRAAFRQHLDDLGVTVDPTSSLFAGLGNAYAARHAEVTAGWIGVTLQREQRGMATFSLKAYIASDVITAVGPGAYELRPTISPRGWAEIQAWPSDTCEGAFVQHPANARWVQLMTASVGDISWALPTPTPPRASGP